MADDQPSNGDSIADKLVDDRPLDEDEKQKLKEKKQKQKERARGGTTRPIENIVVDISSTRCKDFAADGYVVQGFDLKPSGDLQVTYQDASSVGDDGRRMTTVFKDGAYDSFTAFLGPEPSDD